MSKETTIKGRKVNLDEPAPSWKNDFLKTAAREYKTGSIIPALKYLMSDIPIDERFWRMANYGTLKFAYKDEEVLLFTNHGLEQSMIKIIEGHLDISDLILDLSKLVGIAMDRQEVREFKEEIQRKVESGIEKEIIRW